MGRRIPDCLDCRVQSGSRALSLVDTDAQGYDRILQKGGWGPGLVGTSSIVACPNTDPAARLMQSISHPNNRLKIGTFVLHTCGMDRRPESKDPNPIMSVLLSGYSQRSKAAC